MSNWESAQALLASGAQAVSGVGAAVDLGARDRLLRQTLAITVASGSSPWLAVRLEASPDGATGWRSFATFTPIGATAVEKLTFIAPDRYVRVAWTITGSTPSFTFGVSGTKGVVYANLDDFDTHGMPSAAVAKLLPTKRAEALAATTEKMSGKLGLRYDLPLVSWGVDVVEACCKITAYDLLSVRGFNPDGSDDNILKRHNHAWCWLGEVASGDVKPVGIVDSTATIEDDGIVIVTHAPRAWR